MMIRTLAAALATTTCIVTLATPAAAQTREYNVPAGSLRSALDSYARQSGRQVIYSGDVRRARSSGVRGARTAEEALDAILAGTGFVARQDRSGALAIVRANTGQVVGSPGAGEAMAAGAAASDDNAGQSGVAEILVIGSRSQNADIRRTENDIQPRVVFGADEITRSGAATVEEFIRSRLPMAQQTGLTGQSAVIDLTSNRGAINLRGLGANQTLILVDGRRVPSVADGTGFNQASISSIPVGAIERIDVLPATASGIYGGGATGGVVNIILRRDYSGIELEGQFNNTSRWDAAEWQIGLSGGAALEGGRTHITFSASHREESPLYTSGRDRMARRSQELILLNDPASVTSPFFAGNPNICSTPSTTSTTCSGTLLQLDLALGGGLLNSSVTTVPDGYQGIQSDGGAALLANAGRRSLGAPDRTQVLRQDTERSALSLSARREMFGNIELFVDMFASREKYTTFTGADLVINLPANAPENPFQQNILVSVSTPSFVLPSEISLNSYRVNTGIIFRLPFDWSGVVEHDWSLTSSTLSPSSSQGLTAAGLTFLPGVALRDQDIISIPEPISVFNLFQSTTGPVKNRMSDLSLRLSGPIVRLPGGNAAATLLAERREERIRPHFTTAVQNNVSSYRWNPNSSQRVYSFYGEVRAPILGDANRGAGIHQLELIGALRYDDYQIDVARGNIVVPSPDGPFPIPIRSNRGFSSIDYTLGLKYSPVADVILRASYGTGFFPPSISRLLPSTSTPLPATSPSIAILRDSRRGNMPLTGDPANGRVSLILGGNPDLQPEQSESTSFGLILEPRLFRGFRFSADYVKIRKTNEISSISNVTLLSLEASFPERVIRAPRLPGDPADWAGPITGLNTTALNVAATTVESVDLQADYSFSIGGMASVHIYSVISRPLTFRRQTLPNVAAVDLVDFSDGPLRLRGNVGADLVAGAWAAGWNLQFFDSYRVCFSSDASAVCSARINSQGDARIPQQLYNDLYVTYRFRSDADQMSILRGLELSLSVQNIFDHRPPPLAASVLSYSTYGDPRLRRFTLTARRAF